MIAQFENNPKIVFVKQKFERLLIQTPIVWDIFNSLLLPKAAEQNDGCSNGRPRPLLQRFKPNMDEHPKLVKKLLYPRHKNRQKNKARPTDSQPTAILVVRDYCVCIQFSAEETL